MKIAWLGLGSNMGDRETHAAVRRWQSWTGADLRLKRASSLYETEPIGLRDQPWFLNLAAEFETELFPRQLLQRAQRMEREMGRKRTVPNGPRKIDIDVLLYGNAVVRVDELEVPHPRYRERPFHAGAAGGTRP